MNTCRITLLLLVVFACQGQQLTRAQESFRTTYYEQRRTLFESLPDTRNEIVFVGNSITDGGEWTELFNRRNIKNRGISGDTTEGVLFRLPEVTGSGPAKVFLLIGINDLARGASPDSVLSNIIRIAETVKRQSPKTKIYVQSILPVNPDFDKFTGHCSKTGEIMAVNRNLETWCDRLGVYYVDLFTRFTNPTDYYLNSAYTNDGLHLTGAGYLTWARLIKPLL